MKHNKILPRFLNESKPCGEQGSYEKCVIQFIRESSYNCPATCFPMTLSTEFDLPQCQTWDEYRCMREQVEKSLELASTNCPKDCTLVQYSGRLVHQLDSDSARFQSFFNIYHKTKVHKEYLTTTFTDLIGSVGGTLGMFVGISFASLIFTILDFLAALQKLSSNTTYSS